MLRSMQSILVPQLVMSATYRMEKDGVTVTVLLGDLDPNVMEGDLSR